MERGYGTSFRKCFQKVGVGANNGDFLLSIALYFNLHFKDVPTLIHRAIMS